MRMAAASSKRNSRPLIRRLAERWKRFLSSTSTNSSSQTIEVFIDIDGTLVFPGDSFTVPGFAGSYRLAHGAVEFLLALDSIPNVRINFFSAGLPSRNTNLIRQLMDNVRNGPYARSIGQYCVFSVPEVDYGKKKLKGVKKGINLERAILIDDRSMFSERGEERNLLKVYEELTNVAVKTEARRVFKLRLKNNLVRALGLILQSMAMSDQNGCSLVEALNSLQWEGGRYRHKETNARQVYDLGVAAMRQVNPDFQLIQEDATIGAHHLTYPWSHHESDEKIFPHVFVFHSTFFGQYSSSFQ